MAFHPTKFIRVKPELIADSYSMRTHDAPLTRSKQESLYDHLKTLPSGFKERRRKHGVVTYKVDGKTEAGQLEKQTNALAKEIKEKGMSLEFRDALADARLATAEAYAKAAMPMQQMNNLSMSAQAYVDYASVAKEAKEGVESLEQSFPLLQDTIFLATQQDLLNVAYANAKVLYSALGTAARFYREDNPEKYRDYQNMMRAVGQQCRGIYLDIQGGTDPNAHRIEEGEMGFSDKERIGTDNISPCMTIIAQDPVTKKTGLAHLNYKTDPRSLRDFFHHFDPEHRLHIRLVGSRNKDYRSAENISRTLSIIAHTNADIISADIYGGKEGPSAVVVDPQTFEIDEHVPTRASRRTAPYNVALTFSNEGFPLSEQFDFTRDYHSHAVLMTQHMLQYARGDWSMSDEPELDKIYTDLKFGDRAVHIHRIRELMVEYDFVWAQLSKHLEARLEAGHVTEGGCEMARNALLNQPFYVGEKADEANAPLLHWIDHELIRSGRDTPDYHVVMIEDCNRIVLGAPVHHHTQMPHTSCHAADLAIPQATATYSTR